MGYLDATSYVIKNQSSTPNNNDIKYLEYENSKQNQIVQDQLNNLDKILTNFIPNYNNKNELKISSFLFLEINTETNNGHIYFSSTKSTEIRLDFSTFNKYLNTTNNKSDNNNQKYKTLSDIKKEDPFLYDSILQSNEDDYNATDIINNYEGIITSLDFWTADHVLVNYNTQKRGLILTQIGHILQLLGDNKDFYQNKLFKADKLENALINQTNAIKLSNFLVLKNE